MPVSVPIVDHRVVVGGTSIEVMIMGLVGMFFSIVAMAAGAVMYWGVKTPATGFRVGTVGVILMVVGAAGLVVSSIVFATSRHRAGIGAGAHSFDRHAVDAQGRSTVVHEEVR